jgi:hypothetical protein
MTNRWSNQPRPAMSGRHDPTPAAAAAFQAAALTHDLAAQAPACRRATVARARAILIAEERRHRAGLQAQRSALWRVMAVYGLNEADIRRAAS